MNGKKLYVWIGVCVVLTLTIIFGATVALAQVDQCPLGMGTLNPQLGGASVSRLYGVANPTRAGAEMRQAASGENFTATGNCSDPNNTSVLVSDENGSLYWVDARFFVIDPVEEVVVITPPPESTPEATAAPARVEVPQEAIQALNTMLNIGWSDNPDFSEIVNSVQVALAGSTDFQTQVAAGVDIMTQFSGDQPVLAIGAVELGFLDPNGMGAVTIPKSEYVPGDTYSVLLINTPSGIAQRFAASGADILTIRNEQSPHGMEFNITPIFGNDETLVAPRMMGDINNEWGTGSYALNMRKGEVTLYDAENMLQVAFPEILPTAPIAHLVTFTLPELDETTVGTTFYYADADQTQVVLWAINQGNAATMCRLFQNPRQPQCGNTAPAEPAENAGS